MTDTSWPQFDKGRPAAPDLWKQPPGRPKPPEPRPGDPQVVDASQVGLPVVAAEPAAPAQPDEPRPPCKQCGGPVDADYYCTLCGAKAPTPRDHFEEAPASWVGGVCDRGIRHTRNEDALATFAEPDADSRGVLVVCDGVTTSDDSDVASLVAARAARDVLAEGRPETLGTPASVTAAVSALFARAAAVANDAVAAVTKPGATNPAACTFVAALVLDRIVYAGNVGDSRVYWLPDGVEGRVLTRDDSLAEESIASGTPRKQAEEAADAHTITRWLGVDAVDVVPRVTTMHVPGPGWVLVCSDGLWNYASEPSAVAKVLADAVAAAHPVSAAVAEPVEAPGVPPASSGSAPVAEPVESPASPGPVDIARAMVDWAIAQGGHDNISVALARVGVPLRAAPAELPEEVTAKVVRDPDTVETPALPLHAVAPAPASPAADVASTGAPPAEPAGPAAPAASQAVVGYDPVTHQPVIGGATRA